MLQLFAGTFFEDIGSSEVETATPEETLGVLSCCDVCIERVIVL